MPLVALALVGCTGGGGGTSATGGASTPAATGEAQGSCTGAPASGTAATSVKVQGTLGTAPVVSFDKGLSVTKTERTTAIEGTGVKATTGTLLDVAFTIYDATSGKKISTAGYRGMPSTQFTVSKNLYLPGLVDAMQCARVGSRTVTVADASDMFGSNGSESFGVSSGDDIVIVLDLLDTVPLRATGTPQTPKAGFPRVSLRSTGQPKVTIPASKAPSSFELEVLKKGSGEKVSSTGSVTVQYQGTLWRTGKVFDQSWGSGPTTFSLDQVVPGFKKALAGQTVGSQVVAILPPADGYGTAGNDTAGIKGTDTLVFVIDILATS
ncbi:FKBP-type peptidyl-prolyl cis-trans isomerase [Frondihabitans australicus]|uniref:peptidylprolyl isomerase n=1 Tax=Frondihabitans australicus TaxID=386892 RepID=A0A495IEP3_9MICO|nr:FKBP-type peptidyl-prolyl cis-trans isomerase [Frondihabitans australicus]RKR73821.1 peptidylprolyl isomerase [Frondihabitans australicus]